MAIIEYKGTVTFRGLMNKTKDWLAIHVLELLTDCATLREQRNAEREKANTLRKALAGLAGTSDPQEAEAMATAISFIPVKTNEEGKEKANTIKALKALAATELKEDGPQVCELNDDRELLFSDNDPCGD